MVEQREYRLAFILPEFRQVLGMLVSGSAELPRISIPVGERTSEQLTHLIELRWQVKTVVLDFLTDISIPAPCAVIEVRSSSWNFERQGLCPIDPERLSPMSLGERERHALVSILSGNDTGRGPFSRIGWIKDVQEWIRGAIPDQDVNFNDDILQLNAGGRVALIRFGTEQGSPYWLKAVNSTDKHEFWITTMLSQRFPHHLPHVVAAREDWNAWVMEDAGKPLCHSLALRSFEQAAFCLADLQKLTIDHLPALLALGCLDCRISTIELYLADLRQYLEEAMNRQTSTKVPRLGKQRLLELETILRATCSALQELGVPDTLVHNDINLGNILVDESRCRFTDWCEAYVGNPFLTFQMLCALVPHELGDEGPWLKPMRRIYKECWLGYLDEEKIDKALALTPILAIASYLHGRGDWLHSSLRDNPRLQSYSRSLARHMDRAAQSPELLGALCR